MYGHQVTAPPAVSLRRDAIGLREVLFQSITDMAPGAAIAASIPFGAAYAGGSLPLAVGVNVPGALLSLGDGHARQGEGETCGVAVECAMETVVIVDLIKGRPCPWPRLESDTHLITTGSARPLEDAFRIAHVELVHWLGEEYGLDRLDAYQLVTQAVEAPLANVVDTNYTSVAKIRKEWLPGGGPAMGGIHGRLREQAAAYLAAR